MENDIATRDIPLVTEFVQISVPLHTSGIALRDTIEAQLRAYGEPLRWAITAVEDRRAQVEAVVTVVAAAPAPTGPAATEQNHKPA